MKGRIMAVMSGKGGAGKTMMTVSLGTALSRMGKKVLLVDADMGLRDLDLAVGRENEVFYTLWDLARGKCFERDAVIPIDSHLDFLASAQTETWEDVEPEAVSTVFEDLRGNYDAVLIDCPAGVGRGIRFAKSIAGEAAVVVNPTWISRRDAERTLQVLGHYPSFLLFNNFYFSKKGSLSFSDMYDAMEPEHFLGVIPHAEEAEELMQEGRLCRFSDTGAFGTALSMAARVFWEGREYTQAQWERILRMADRSSLPEHAGLPDALKKKGMHSRIRYRGHWRNRRG